MAEPVDRGTGATPVRRVAVRTLGCKVNTFESEQISTGLERTGQWVRVDDCGPADLYIVNSCTVTREADRQTRQVIRRCIRDNPNARVEVTGCYAEMDASACAEIEGVNLVVGNDLKLRIPELLQRMDRNDDLPRVVSSFDVDGLLAVPDPVLSGFGERSRAFVQIQQGCDQGCTFCIIHRARGASRSIPAERVLEQVRRLRLAGFEEFVLCGVDLGSWGADLDGAPNLADLVENILALAGAFRVRLGSLDPVHIDARIIDLMAAEERLCPHLHISMQSGHTLILKRMKRRYDSDLLHRCVELARSRIPRLVIGADVMTGFPTEEPAHFEATLGAVRDLGVAFPHVFPYSPREGTPAARIPRQVPVAERQARAQRVRELGEEVLADLLTAQVGTRQPALPEVVDATTGEGRARLDNYLQVRFRTGDDAPGGWRPVDIEGADRRMLHGSDAK